jgi:hypothetical protein
MKQQMFQTMKNYGLGIEEATRALIVRKAFQREILAGDEPGKSSTTTTSPGVNKIAVNAIEKLISKVSLDNLLYESDSSADMNSDSDEERLSIRPDLRINPVSSGTTASGCRNMDRKKSKDYKHNSSNTSPKSKNPCNKTTSSKSKTLAPSPSLSGRKRKIEDAAASCPRDETTSTKRRAKNNGKLVSNDQSSPEHLSSSSSRSRSDSDSSVVDAKITAILPTTASRPKRPHRNGPTGGTGSQDDAAASSSEIK